MGDPFETNFTKAQAANENLTESSRDVYSAIASLLQEQPEADFVIKNNKPSLPANLDEAAEKYSENILANNEDLQDAIEDAFKEGAKWMAGQKQAGVELEKEVKRWKKKHGVVGMDDLWLDFARYIYGLVLNAGEK